MLKEHCATKLMLQLSEGEYILCRGFDEVKEINLDYFSLFKVLKLLNYILNDTN